MSYRHVRAHASTPAEPPRRRKPAVRPRTDRIALQRSAEERIAKALTQRFAWFLDPVRLNAIAEDLRVLERQRDLNLGIVVISVILSALSRSSDSEGRVRDAFAVYRQIDTETTVSDEAFRKALGRTAVVLLHLLKQWMREVDTEFANAPLRGRLAFFKDLLITDSTSFKLARAMVAALPGSGSSAAFKLHAIYSVCTQTAVSVEATAGREHDSPHFQPKWIPGALYLWDLGYNDYARAVACQLAGSFFAQRLKDKANPRVLAYYDEQGRHAVSRGERGALPRLDDVLASSPELLHGGVLDLDVVVEGRSADAVLRVVCVPTQGQDRYYLTNLPREHFTPFDVAEIYAARWDVELLFKDWQGGCRIDEVARLSNLDTLRAITYGGLLAHLLSREVTRAANDDSRDEAAAEQEEDAPERVDEAEGTEDEDPPQTTSSASEPHESPHTAVLDAVHGNAPIESTTEAQASVGFPP